MNRLSAIVHAQDQGQTAIDVTTTVDGKQNTAKVDVAVLHKALVSELQVHTVQWMSDIPGSCNSRRFFGVWLGYPLKFKTTLPIQSGTDAITRRRLEVTEIIAGGYGFSPNAYISVLMGFSVGLTNLPPGDDDQEVVATFVLGLGGNLDILTLLRD